jgi:hypothetical protein
LQHDAQRVRWNELLDNPEIAMRWSRRPPEGPQPWLRWFAWHPVNLNQRNEWAWLEWVERQRFYMYDFTRAEAFWLYRIPKT